MTTCVQARKATRGSARGKKAAPEPAEEETPTPAAETETETPAAAAGTGLEADEAAFEAALDAAMEEVPATEVPAVAVAAVAAVSDEDATAMEEDAPKDAGELSYML